MKPRPYPRQYGNQFYQGTLPTPLPLNPRLERLPLLVLRPQNWQALLRDETPVGSHLLPKE